MLYLETYFLNSDKQNSKNSRLLQPKLKETSYFEFFEILEIFSTKNGSIIF